jgi:chemotaxis protein MotB
VRKKKHPEHVNHERWLVSYADFITLLFAFFVVMFAVSQVDAQKLGRFVESVNVAFEFRGAFPESSRNPIHDQDHGSVGIAPTIAPTHGTIVAPASSTRRASRLKAALQRSLRNTKFADKVRVRVDRRGVVVSLSEAGFFDPGSAAVRDASIEALGAVADGLKEEHGPIAVEGHTDNIPISTAQFPTNWELSTARATTIVRYLVDKNGLAPERLSATGYAEYRPEGDNATPEGRASNRRVDLVLLPDGASGPAPK